MTPLFITFWCNEFVRKRLPPSFSPPSERFFSVSGGTVKKWSHASVRLKPGTLWESPPPAAKKIVRAFSLLLKTNQSFSKQELATSILIVSPQRESPCRRTNGTPFDYRCSVIFDAGGQRNLFIPRRNVCSLQNQLNAHLLNCSDNVHPRIVRTQTQTYALAHAGQFV